MLIGASIMAEHDKAIEIAFKECSLSVDILIPFQITNVVFSFVGNVAAM